MLALLLVGRTETQSSSYLGDRYIYLTPEMVGTADYIVTAELILVLGRERRCPRSPSHDPRHATKLE